jgi:hypothetical protein
LLRPKTEKWQASSFLMIVARKMDKHRIYSNNAGKLLGTIYMPNGALYIDSKKLLADRSDYTVIIARSVELFDGPDLVLTRTMKEAAFLCRRA